MHSFSDSAICVQGRKEPEVQLSRRRQTGTSAANATTQPEAAEQQRTDSGILPDGAVFNLEPSSLEPSSLLRFGSGRLCTSTRARSQSAAVLSAYA